MKYISREKLTCISISEDKVFFDELKPILMENPSNVVFGEKNGKIYGIISMGDIKRASEDNKDYVTVNRCFTYVRPNQYMRAKQIFESKNRINALPVVNDSNELLGYYSRWDDFESINDFEQLNKGVEAFFEKTKNFALVRPCKKFVKKQELMQIWYENLLKRGGGYRCP